MAGDCGELAFKEHRRFLETLGKTCNQSAHPRWRKRSGSRRRNARFWAGRLKTGKAAAKAIRGRFAPRRACGDRRP